MKPIGGSFGPNVVEPLYEHLCKGRHCAELVTELVEALLAGDMPRMQELGARINEAELQADHIKLAIRHGLTKSIFAAVQRTDVLQIVRYQDRIADRSQDIAKLLVLRHTTIAPAAGDVLRILMHSVLDTINALATAVQAMIPPDEGTAPAGQHTDMMADALERIHVLENKSDQQIEQFLKVLFEHERESDAISVIMLFQAARLVGQMADAAENAAEFYAAMATT